MATLSQKCRFSNCNKLITLVREVGSRGGYLWVGERDIGETPKRSPQPCWGSKTALRNCNCLFCLIVCFKEITLYTLHIYNLVLSIILR